MTNDDCPHCSLKDDKGGKLQEFEDTDGMTYFRCARCHTVFELQEKEND